jgi:F-type H+-transporting ATPase subunit gamma
MSESTAGLRRKIAEAGDLRSVVRTMKSVAASNIGQYQSSVRALVDYYRTVELGLGAYFRKSGLSQPFIKQKNEKITSISAVVFGSDQGLVGQFNDLITDFTIKELNTMPMKAKIWAVGERVQSRLSIAGISSSPVGLFAVPNSVEAITPLIGQIIEECANPNDPGENIELQIFYNSPTSGAIYTPKSQRVLPLDEIWQRRLIDLPWPTKSLPEVLDCGALDDSVTLRALIREYIFVSLFRACAESLASENASRLAAMQRADKNINELLVDLSGTFHRLRQSGIDEELFDVISGFEALSSKGENVPYK